MSELIVITGVSRGLGRAMLEAFCREGFFVAGCSRSTAACHELQQLLHGRCDVQPVDITDEGQVAAWAAATAERFPSPRLLINNAAVINANQRLWQVPAAEFQAVIDINIAGTARIIRHFVPRMIAAGSGVIVNFSSGWGRSTSAEVAPYCASKWAIEGLTLALAQELPRGIAAVSLNPGVIDTDMLRSCFREGAAGYPAPAEWAQRAVPFLLSLSGRHNGRQLTVPGEE
ncbi:MAG: Serine 3-dehydrogenase [Planctomycetota bacterium]|jgi:NAD(P)-dependent dehydrogenase (short-subunit alcohol dehydrogenase family)